MDDRGQDVDESPSAEDQYQIVSICTFGVARLNKKLQKHFSGEKVMTKKDLEATFVEIDELMQGCREHVLREYVHLDSDIVESIDHETVTNLEDDDEESDGDETSPPPASPTSKKKGTAKGRPGPRGKGKGSTTTLNETGKWMHVVSSRLLLSISHIHTTHIFCLPGPFPFPKKGRPTEDDDKEEGIISVSDEEEEDGDDGSSQELVVMKWPKPKYYTDREDQVYEFEEDAEESQEMVVAGRKDLRDGRRPFWRVNYLMVLCPCPLEQRRQLLLELCTRQVPGRLIITKIEEIVDGLIFLYDVNQDITDQIAAKDAAEGRRIRRGPTLGRSLKLLSQSLNPPAMSSEVFLAGERAFDEAKSMGLINPEVDTKETAIDRQMRHYLHPNEVFKSFINLCMHAQSAYVAFLHVPTSEIINLVSEKYKEDATWLYNEICDVDLEENEESLSFVLNLSKHLDSFPDDGPNSEEEIRAVQTFVEMKEALIDHPTVWTEHVRTYSTGEDDDAVGANSGGDEDDDYFDNDDNRRAATNVLALLSCGKQIGKAAREHDTSGKYEDIEDPRSVVLRCSMDKLGKTAKSLVSTRKRFMAKGAAVATSKDGTNKFDDMYDFSSGRIVAFEKDALVAFDLNGKENAEEKDRLAFSNMAFSTS